MNKSRVIPSVQLLIRRGQASPAQKTTWHKFWAKVIAEAKQEPAK